MAALLYVLAASPALVVNAPLRAAATIAPRASANMQGAREPFKLALDLGKNGKGQLKFKPMFPESEAVVVKYQVPFGLNVENQGGQAVCTKDGAGGEKVGDILSESPLNSLEQERAAASRS